jgi:hypothetical protein
LTSKYGVLAAVVLEVLMALEVAVLVLLAAH